MVENLPANAGNTGSRPGLGRSHMPQSNWAREPQLLSLRVWSLCSATREAAIVRGPHTAMKSGPRLPQLEKALEQKRRPNIAINQSIDKFKKKKKKEREPDPNECSFHILTTMLCGLTFGSLVKNKRTFPNWKFLLLHLPFLY